MFFQCQTSALNSVGMVFEYQAATETQIKDVRSFPQSIHVILRNNIALKQVWAFFFTPFGESIHLVITIAAN